MTQELYLNIAATTPRTEAEGPGLRYALWVQGCPFRCSGCCNPHMLEFKPANRRSVEEVAAEILALDNLEGVTFVGGEPFSQAEALAALATRVRRAGLSVMTFTGFTIEQLQKANRADFDAFLRETDLLVDGLYDRNQPDESRRWIGSKNQRLIPLSDRYRREVENGWNQGANTIEIRMVNGRISINGFPHADITKALEAMAKK